MTSPGQRCRACGATSALGLRLCSTCGRPLDDRSPVSLAKPGSAAAPVLLAPPVPPTPPVPPAAPTAPVPPRVAPAPRTAPVSLRKAGPATAPVTAPIRPPVSLGKAGPPTAPLAPLASPPPASPPPVPPSRPAGGRGRTALWAAAGAVAVLLLGAGAYAVTVPSDDGPSPEDQTAAPPSAPPEDADTTDADTTDEGGTDEGGAAADGTTDAEQPAPPVEPEPLPPPGPLQPQSASATCTSPPAQDTLGLTVTYEASRTLDGQADTAWRCPGSAVGAQLVYDFATAVTVTSVALVPGYDKVDPVDDIDRFTANRTVTAVSWTFDDGTTVRQDLGRASRRLTEQELAAPERTQRVVLTILSTGNDGAEVDHTPVSEVAFRGN